MASAQVIVIGKASNFLSIAAGKVGGAISRGSDDRAATSQHPMERLKSFGHANIYANSY